MITNIESELDIRMCIECSELFSYKKSKMCERDVIVDVATRLHFRKERLIIVLLHFLSGNSLDSAQNPLMIITTVEGQDLDRSSMAQYEC
jgi:hypothetical protein